jgi:hypothetical protein
MFAATLVGASVAGCDSSPAPSDAGLAIGDPSVAWRPQPFRVAGPILAAAIASCQKGGIPLEARPVLADARGLDRITLLFESADRTTSASCSTLRSADATWQSTGSSVASGSQPEDLPGADDVAVGIESEGGDTVNGLTAPGRTIALGRVGIHVAAVQVVVAGRPIAATVGNGWFSAWWPTGDRITQVTAIGGDGQPLPQTSPATR